MDVHKKLVLSSDGEHTLQGVVYVPDGTPKGYFQVVHGMCEYVGRYESFMTQLAGQGYLVFGFDHLGHGHTARSPEELGFIASRDGWLRLLDDVSVFYKAVAAEYGPMPYILFGHSMGSFIVRGAVERGAKPDRLIVCGTGGPNPASGAGLAACRTVKALRGEHHVSKTLQNLAFGAYNKRFADEHDPYAWLTKDLSVRDAYRNDPFCTYSFQAAAMVDLIRLQSFCNRKAHFAAFPKTLPTLLIAGAQDPVGDYGKGVQTVYDRLRAAGCNVQLHLYPDCRHEILNDTCRQQVMNDIAAFLA